MANASVNVGKPAPQGDGPVQADPYGDPVAYLLAKGWKCLGNPEWQSAMWLDPTQPLVSYYSEQECMYDAEVREEYTDPADGLKKVRYRVEQRHVLAQDGRGGALQSARRQVFHPKVTPINLGQALMTQIERDAAETLKADEAKRLEQKGRRG